MVKLYAEPLIYPGTQGELEDIINNRCHLQYTGKSEMIPFQDQFTPKEIVVADYLVNGFSLKEIAVLTDSSPRTIEKHVASLKVKVNACSMNHLLSILFRSKHGKL